jgi:hypothetical protein
LEVSAWKVAAASGAYRIEPAWQAIEVGAAQLVCAISYYSRSLFGGRCRINS